MGVYCDEFKELIGFDILKPIKFAIAFLIIPFGVGYIMEILIGLPEPLTVLGVTATVIIDMFLYCRNERNKILLEDNVEFEKRMEIREELYKLKHPDYYDDYPNHSKP